MLTMDLAPVERVTPYACQDADFALALGRMLWPKVEAAGIDRVYRDLELPLVEILAEMETTGVRIDRRPCRALEGMEADLRRLEADIHAQAGTDFNIKSPKQLGEILFHKLGLPMTRKTKGTGGLSHGHRRPGGDGRQAPHRRRVVEYRQTPSSSRPTPTRCWP